MLHICAQCMLMCLLVSLVRADQETKATVKLVEAIQKKQYDAFTKELAKEAIDVNQPTPNGKLPLIEAVKTKDVKYVDSLIQYQATVNVREPSTGATPIMLAFQASLVDIAKLLLAYGADPSVAAKNEKKATDVMTSSAIKDLYAAWEKDGASAFEDAPGAWVKVKDEKTGTDYWFNKGINEGRWNMPPSCAWQRVEQKDAPPAFVNYVTGQTVHTTPVPLSWSKIRLNKEDLWYNWATNFTQREQPDELPQYLADEANKNVNVRWYNEKTDKFSWVDPKANVHWRAITEGDKTYYYNIASGASQWEVPDQLAWKLEEHQEGKFWYNAKTGESLWDHPDESWVKHDSDL